MADAASKKRKYKLFNAADDRPNSEKPCAFFFSPAGCRNAEKCSFSHIAEQEKPVPVEEKKSFDINIKHPPKPSSGSGAPVAAQTSNAKVRSNNSSNSSEVSPRKSKSRKDSMTQGQAVTEKSEFEKIQEDMIAQQKKIAALQKQLEAKAAVAQAQAQTSKESNNGSSNNKDKETKPKKQKKEKEVQKKIPVSAPALAPAPAPAHVAYVALEGGFPSNFLLPKTPVAVKSNDKGNGKGNTTQEKIKKEKEEEEADDAAFLFGAVNTALKVETPSNARVEKSTANANATAATIAMATLPTPIKSKSNQANATTPATGTHSTSVAQAHASISINNEDFPFLDKNDLKDIENARNLSGGNKSNGNGSENVNSNGEAINLGNVDTKAIQAQLQKANVMQLQWGSLLQKTQDSPRYVKDYTLPSDHSWVTSKAYGQWCVEKEKKLPPIIAIDCEMCQSVDPVTGEKDPNTLIRFSVINGLNPSEVLIDELVQPTVPITDIRSYIHGITSEQLQDVKYTLRQAQAALLEICSDRTIIIGHSVHNDLKALRFQHTACIDTSYLFTLENEPGQSPSMRDVTEHIMGQKLSDVHNSVEDAKASLQAATYLLAIGEPSPCKRSPKAGSDTNTLSQSLLIHRIPEDCTARHLFRMVMTYTSIVPTAISVAGASNKPSSTNPNSTITTEAELDHLASAAGLKLQVTFATQQHAELAFNSIPGPDAPDKSGKSQKKIFFKLDQSKNGNGNNGKVEDKKHASGGGKKRRTSTNDYLCIRKNI